MIKKAKQGYITFLNIESEIKENDVLNGNFLVYESMQDSLRFTKLDDDKIVTKVTVLGDYKLVDSDYYGYFNMAVTDKVLIDKILTYDDVITEALNNKFGKYYINILTEGKLKNEAIDNYEMGETH